MRGGTVPCMTMIAIAACLALGLLWGCGQRDDRAEITDLMAQMREAQDSGNAEEACEKVYVVREPNRPAEEEEEEGEEEGGECETVFEQSVERRRDQVKDLRTKLVGVQVEGDEGTAVLHTTLTRQDGSRLERDVHYPVVHTEKGWRVRISPE